MELYKLEGVYKTYKFNDIDNHALNNIDLTINEGEIVVILGPSGSGKSTMLNLLSGIDYPTRGHIYFNNVKIDKMRDLELTDYRKKNLGFIFQSYNLVSSLTVKENVELGKELADCPLDMDEVIKAVDLKDQRNKYPYQLSGGQMQRVAIARSLVKNPKVLFCDEPTGALDEKTGKKVLELLQEINEKYKTTMIIVTHNPSIALMANTVIKMNSGEIKEIIHNKKVAKADELRWA
ncbi:MAG TPA: ABC transporter ATP-binding protein [Bacilli bacterium]|nr:ABC transporter ATP-binding protein [Bacilli bacterium]